MGAYSWLILIGIFVIFLLVAFFEIRLDAANEYYKCYSYWLYKGTITDFKCPGMYDSDKCEQCPYHKRYLKTLKPGRKLNND